MAWPKDKPLPQATRDKIAATLRGHSVSPEARQKIAAAMLGNTHGVGHTVSRKARRRIGASQKGNSHAKGLKRSAEQCRKLAERMKGNKIKLGKKDSATTIARKRGTALALCGRLVLPSPSPGIVGFVPDYRAERALFFRP